MTTATILLLLGTPNVSKHYEIPFLSPHALPPQHCLHAWQSKGLPHSCSPSTSLHQILPLTLQ